MTVFLCTDDRGGMLFNKRRQSRDFAVIADIAKSVGDKILYISYFSENLLSESEISVISVPDPLTAAGDGSCVFIENLHISDFIHKIDTLVIYRWNKKYPYDFSLDIEPKECGYTLSETYDIVGKSHEKITKEIYRK